MAPHNEGDRDMSKKNRKVAEVAQVVEQATLQSVGVQSEVAAPIVESVTVAAPTVAPVAIVETGNKLQVYKALSEVQRDIEVDENTVVPLTNKRAMVAALYCVVCKALGVNTATPGTMQQPIVRYVAKLLPYANTGYSKQKGRILQGSEVTASGMLQYARFLQKPECAKLLPSGELHTRTVQAMKGAEAIFAKHSAHEGYSALVAQYGNTTSK